MHRSGYMLAAYDTLSKILYRFAENRKGRFEENFEIEHMADYLANICSGFLYSYGEDFRGRKKYKSYNKKCLKVFRRSIDSKFFAKAPLVLDSGGYQISTGRLNKEESLILTRMYYEFLREHHNIISKAFILDLPPGPGCCIFNNFSDVYEWNLKTYLEAKEFEDDLRNKIIYIHHIRTPSMWNIYTKILREYEMFPSFKYFGTGGMAANMKSDIIIPCIIYIIAIIPLLNECKKYGRDELNFHVLGGAGFRDLLFYGFFEKCVWEHHKIKLNITYDSTALFKQVMQARFIQVETNCGNMMKMEFKSCDLHKRFYEGKSVKEKLQDSMNHIADVIGIKRINLDGVYNEEGSLHYDIKVYSMLYALNKFSEIELLVKDFVNENYPLYLNNEYASFSRNCINFTTRFNQGRMTRKTQVKTNNIIQSLTAIKNLDEDYCKHVVDNVLIKDEFTELSEHKPIIL